MCNYSKTNEQYSPYIEYEPQSSWGPILQQSYFFHQKTYSPECSCLVIHKSDCSCRTWKYTNRMIRILPCGRGYERNCSNIQTNEARSCRAPKNSGKEYFWERHIKAELLSRDANLGTNYYVRYLRKKARAKARRHAMGDRVGERGIACCVIL